jgi:hypothetical protein
MSCVHHWVGSQGSSGKPTETDQESGHCNPTLYLFRRIVCAGWLLCRNATASVVCGPPVAQRLVWVWGIGVWELVVRLVGCR